MPTPPIIDDDARMVPMPPPPPPHMGSPMTTPNAEAQIHRMINEMDPFMRRRSAFPAMAPPNHSSSVKRTTASGHRDSQAPFTVYGFKLTKCLGRGTFSKVFLGVNKTTEEQVALKFIKNRPASKSDKHDVRVQRETNILTVINHPNIIRIMKRADTKNNTVLVMEYAQGGELLSYIRQHGRLREEEARKFFREVISAIDYCHQHGILHRDLKLENIMLDEKKHVKIIDFGFANIFFRDRLLDTFCGSPFYAAPEMVNGVRYRGPEVDIWSMGVILFFMLIGRTPFEGENLREIYQKISQGMYTIPPHMNISNAAADLIRHMLNTSKETRISMTQVRLHPWVNEGYSELPPNYCKPRPNHPPAQPNMYIVRQVASRFKMSEMQVLEGLNNNPVGESPIVGLYYLFEDYLAKRQAEKLNRRTSRNQELQPPHSREKLGSRMSMPVGERPSGSSLILGKNGAPIDPKHRRSFHPGNPVGPSTPKPDRRSAYTLTGEYARGRGSRKLSTASIRRESSDLPVHPTPYPHSPYGPAPLGHADYFDRPKHLSHISGESPTTNSFWSSFLGNSRSKVNNKSSNFEQNSLGNISVGIMDSSAPNLEKKARKSALFHSIIMRARKSMPFLIRGHGSPPPSPKVPSPMPPTTTTANGNGNGLTPGYNNPNDVRHSAVLSAPSTPMSPGFPASSNVPYTALPSGIPPPMSGPPLSPVSHPAMHLMHPMPPTKHVIRPALSQPNVMSSSRGMPELTAAAAAAAALAPPPMSIPVTPMVVPAPVAPMTPTSMPYVPAPLPVGGATGKASGKAAGERGGVMSGFLEDKRNTLMSAEKLKNLVLAISSQFHFRVMDISPHVMHCAVEQGKYKGQTFDVEITSPNPGQHAICLRHQKGNWITFKKMTNRMYKAMHIDR
ncbi:hypothetical protein IWQ61_008493 [Dispira simplex]|nr:hypothetical protein IWQ61_008493 [Dispira simplex]